MTTKELYQLGYGLSLDLLDELSTKVDEGLEESKTQIVFVGILSCFFKLFNDNLCEEHKAEIVKTAMECAENDDT